MGRRGRRARQQENNRAKEEKTSHHGIQMYFIKVSDFYSTRMSKIWSRKGEKWKIWKPQEWCMLLDM